MNRSRSGRHSDGQHDPNADRNGGVDRRILRLAFPALGALAVEPVYVLVDTAIVGQLGTEQLAGLAVAATVLSFVFAGANFLTYGTTERVARRLGAGDRASAADVGVQAMWLSLLFGVPAAPLLAFGAGPRCRAFGATGPTKSVRRFSPGRIRSQNREVSDRWPGGPAEVFAPQRHFISACIPVRCQT